MYPLSVKVSTAALRDAEAAKEAAGGRRCAARGWGYVGSAFSTWGMAGPASRYVLGEVVRRATNTLSGRSAIIAAMGIRQTLALTLARSVALQLRAKNRVLDALDTDL